jgi:ganglioside-induced differentiation-associated protein 1
MLTLFHHGSSVCAAKVRFALAEKKIAWTSKYVDILSGEQFDREFLKVNPKAMVPVLVHEGNAITESTLICEYVEQTFPEPPVYPSDALGRYRARLWTKAVDEDLHPACSAITYIVSHRHTIMRHGLGQFEDFLKAPSNESVEARKLKWQWLQHGLGAPGATDKIRLYLRYLHKMEDTLQECDWLAGEYFSIADIAMTPYVNRLAMMAMSQIWEDGRLPNVERWFRRIMGRDGFKSALLQWIPDDLKNELWSNGVKSWPEIERIINSTPSPLPGTAA